MQLFMTLCLKDPAKWPDGYPEIFVLDIVMPGIAGGELAQVIREQRHLKGIPIVFFTASDRVVTREEVERAGGTIGGEVFLTKGKLGIQNIRFEILKRTGRLPNQNA